jgi:hypothetical protein
MPEGFCRAQFSARNCAIDRVATYAGDGSRFLGRVDDPLDRRTLPSASFRHGSLLHADSLRLFCSGVNKRTIYKLLIPKRLGIVSKVLFFVSALIFLSGVLLERNNVEVQRRGSKSDALRLCCGMFTAQMAVNFHRESAAVFVA